MSEPRQSPLQGREVVIVEAARTPIGRGHPQKGQFRDLHPNELLGAAYRAVIERAGVEPALVEDVVAGAVTQVGEQSNNIARNAWLQAGLPVTTPASTVDRQCGSGQQAVSFAAGLIAAGVHDVMIGAGVEHMGRVPMGSNVAHIDEFGTPFPPELMARYELIPQGLSAELIADRWEVTRGRAGRARAAVASTRGARDRRGPLRARDRSDPRQRLDRHARSGDPPGYEPRAARCAQAGVQGWRHRHGGKLLADLRRRSRGAVDGAREG